MMMMYTMMTYDKYLSRTTATDDGNRWRAHPQQRTRGNSMQGCAKLITAEDSNVLIHHRLSSSHNDDLSHAKVVELVWSSWAHTEGVELTRWPYSPCIGFWAHAMAVDLEQWLSRLCNALKLAKWSSSLCIDCQACAHQLRLYDGRRARVMVVKLVQLFSSLCNGYQACVMVAYLQKKFEQWRL
jgi:hypothetical protein